MSIAMVEPRQLEMAVKAAPRKRSRDALPEHTRYRDDGCSVSPSCFTCPLPRCRYEEPGGLRAVLNQQRDNAMLEMRARGASVEELAARFSVSRRTVFRVLEGTSPRSRRRRELSGNAPVPMFLRREPRSSREEANCA